MNVLSLLGGWQVKIVILLALLFAAWTWHKAEVKIAVKEALSQIEAQQARENFRLKERSLNTQIELQAKVDKIEKDKNNEIANLKSRVRTLTDSLSSRPNRAESGGISDSTGNEESKQGATGSGLYQDDGVFLARFAGMAEELKVELQGCYKQYDEAKETLDKFKRDNTPKSH